MNLVACPLMNTLIEDAMTLEYLTSNNQWTKNATAGKDFGATATALAVAELEPIGKFNIVGYFPVTKQLVNMFHGRGKGLSEAGAV
jgi:hypothetical protein